MSKKSPMILLLCIFYLFPSCSFMPKEENILVPPLVKPVQQDYDIHIVGKSSIVNRLLGQGVFEPIRVEHYRYDARLGHISNIYVQVGDFVQSGDVLMEYDPGQLVFDLERKKIELYRLNIQLEKAKSERDEERIIEHMMLLNLAQKEYDLFNEKFQSMSIVSSIDGQVIYIKDIDPTELLGNAEVLVSIADISEFKLSFRSASAELDTIPLGIPCKIIFNEIEYTGTVVQNEASEVYIQSDQPIPDAKIGYSAQIEIILDQKDDVITIPRRGLRSYLDREYVYVLEDDDRIKEIDVETGLKTATEVEIVKGLEVGQKVLLQ